jgi:hypothetical protein
MLKRIGDVGGKPRCLSFDTNSACCGIEQMLEVPLADRARGQRRGLDALLLRRLVSGRQYPNVRKGAFLHVMSAFSCERANAAYTVVNIDEDGPIARHPCPSKAI